MNKVFLVFIIVSLFPGTGVLMANPVQKIKKVIRNDLDNPVISKDTIPVPGLLHFSAYDKSWLNEDPLIPYEYYLYRDGEVCRRVRDVDFAANV